MLNDPHQPESCIMLSPVVLEPLKGRMPASVLSVYIYLCSCNEGHQFSAPISQIKAATGLAQRSVVKALKVLREQKLVTSISEKGNQPNQYEILLPKRPASPSAEVTQTMAPTTTPTQATKRESLTVLPSTRSGPVTPSAEIAVRATSSELSTVPLTAKSGEVIAPDATPTRTTATEHIPALPNLKSGQLRSSDLAPMPALTPISELVANLYRRLTPEELPQVNRYRTEALLRDRLGRMSKRGAWTFVRHSNVSFWNWTALSRS